MAIITCPECGHQVSDLAPTCIHCGYPIAPSMSCNNTNTVTPPPNSTPAHEKILISKTKLFLIAGSIFIALIILISAWLFFSSTSHANNLVGIWETVVPSEDNDLTLRYEFRENSEFHSFVILNGIQVPGGDGTYIVDGDTVIVTMANGEILENEFDFKDGTLTYLDMTWMKVE